jgi:hypothetical protein
MVDPWQTLARSSALMLPLFIEHYVDWVSGFVIHMDGADEI